MMKMIVAVLTVFLGTCGIALAQSSGGSASGGGSAAGSGASSGSTLSNGAALSGTGGAPGSNTANAQQRGTTGNNLGAPSSGAPAAAASQRNSVTTPAANGAMQTLGKTDTGILRK